MDTQLNEASLKSVYVKCYKHLKLNEHPDAGVNILMTTKWMMIVPLVGPYTNVRGKDIFVEPLGYAGLMNI